MWKTMLAMMLLWTNQYILILAVKVYPLKVIQNEMFGLVNTRDSDSYSSRASEAQYVL